MTLEFNTIQIRITQDEYLAKNVQYIIVNLLTRMKTNEKLKILLVKCIYNELFYL